MTNELDKMSLIPRHIRELLKDFIKVSRQVIKTSETLKILQESDKRKKTSLGLTLEKKIIEENSKQSDQSFLAFRILEEIESLKGIENK